MTQGGVSLLQTPYVMTLTAKLAMPFHRSTWCLLILAVFVPGVLRAQIEGLYDHWRWVRFGSEAGLPSEKIKGIYESPDGTVWVQTREGLAKFDGFLWHPVDMPGIPKESAGIGRVTVDTAGLLMCADENVLEVRRRRVRQLGLFHERDTLRGYYAWREPTGTTVVQGDSSLYRLVGDSLVHLPSPYDSSFAQWLPPKPVDNFLLATQNDLWLKAGLDLFRFQGGRWVRRFESEEGFLRLHHLVDDGSGNGLAVLEPTAGRVDLYEWTRGGILRKLQGESGDLILSIAPIRTGEFLLLYASGEVRLRSEGTWTWLPPLPPPVERPTLLRFRENGDLWVGSDRGLFLCRLSSTRWSAWQGPPASLENIVNEIFRATDGSFWIGTRDGVRHRFNDGRVEATTHIDGIQLGRVTAINEDEQGQIWIGSGASFRGSFRWDGKRWTHIGTEQGLDAPRIHKIYRDRKGRLWFLGISKGDLKQGLRTDPGAFVYDRGTFVHWGPAEGLLDGRVYSMLEDRRGGLWFGTWSGISRLRDGVWKYWTLEDGLALNRVWDLAEDSTGRVLLCHQWRGLGIIEPNDSLHYVMPDKGLVSGQIWDVAVDDRGRIWVGSMEGLGCYAEGEWTTFDAHSGLPNSMLWPVLPYGGKVYCGTQGSGVAVLSLPELNHVAPTLKILEPEVKDDIVTITWSANAYWADTPPAALITRYRLDGGSWSSWNSLRSAVFSSLKSGQHRFEVQSSPPFGTDTAHAATALFSVPPPLLLRPVVAIPIILLSMLAAGLAVTGYLRKRRYDRVIRENEATFRAQYKGNPIPTFTWKRHGHDFLINDFNEAAVKLTLGEVHNWVGQSFRDVLSHIPQALEDIDRCWTEKTTIHREVEYRYRLVDRVAHFDATYTYVPPDLVLIHTQDVTERKMSEKRIHESREQLRALAARLESIREEERTALSREIHDELGQIMTGLKMDLAWIKRHTLEMDGGLPEAVASRMAQMNSLLEDSIHTVRKIAGELRPAVLDDLGLSVALEWQAREFQERTGISCVASVDSVDRLLTKKQATDLFRISQELLTNVARHARATRVRVVLNLQDREVVLEVRDNGRGIRPEDLKKPSALGILGMEERARQIGAIFTIEPDDEGGTIARVSLPGRESAER